MPEENRLAIYQNDQGAIELAVDADAETIWATRAEMAQLFNVTPQNITMHLKSIYSEHELDRASTSKESLLVQDEGGRQVSRKISQHNLDAVIAVAYRVGSKTGTEFRKWATKTLKNYIVDGFAIDPGRVNKHNAVFIQAMNDMQLLAADNQKIGSTEATELSKQFAKTWLSLDAYDKSDLPKSGIVKKNVNLKASQLHEALTELKTELINKGEATELFAQEKNAGSFEGLFGNVFASFGGEDVYPTLEEKAAHLLYFTVKNHVFNDGNKRSGAYSFVWFLNEVNLLNTSEISPQALTAITLLIAQSDPSEKDKMVGLVLMMLGAQSLNGE